MFYPFGAHPQSTGDLSSLESQELAVVIDNSRVLDSYNFIQDTFYSLNTMNRISNPRLLAVSGKGDKARIITILASDVTSKNLVSRFFGRGPLANTHLSIHSIADHFLQYSKMLSHYSDKSKIAIGQIAARSILYNRDSRLATEFRTQLCLGLYGYLPGTTYRDEYFRVVRSGKSCKSVVDAAFKSINANSPIQLQKLGTLLARIDNDCRGLGDQTPLLH